MVAGGWHRVFIVNGHGGNHELIQLVARDLALEHDVHLGGGLLVGDRVGRARGGRSRRRRDGSPDTPGASRPRSCWRCARSWWSGRSRTATTRVPTGPPVVGGELRAEHHGLWQAIDGYGDSPDLADAELGRRWLMVGSQEVAKAYAHFDFETREG